MWGVEFNGAPAPVLIARAGFDFLGDEKVTLHITSLGIGVGLHTQHPVAIRKADRARKILAYSDIRVKELANMMGFRDVKYFSRLFRKYAGVSPRRQTVPPTCER